MYLRLSQRSAGRVESVEYDQTLAVSLFEESLSLRVHEHTIEKIIRLGKINELKRRPILIKFGNE